MQFGHFVAFIFIVEKHLGHGLVSSATVSSVFVSAAALNLLINLMSKNTAKATKIKLINVFIKDRN